MRTEVEGLTRTRLRELCFKINEDKYKKAYENSTMCIVQQGFKGNTGGERTRGGGGKADLDGRCRAGEISRRRKPLRWRVRAEGDGGGKGRGRRWSKMPLRSIIVEDEEIARH